MTLFSELIRKKRDGHALTSEEIDVFVRGIVDGSLPSEQVAAMAMAIFFRGMSFDEGRDLTFAMAQSGETFTWSELGVERPTVDKHSTGGVGDKISLALVPILVACGAADPMISGRALGHTGGTLDKLEAIPGFNVNLTTDQFIRQMKSLSTAFIGQTENLVPADRRLYAIRDVTETVDSVPLITASILSKKIAAGPRALVVDLKVGNGAFMQSMDDARALAESLIATAGDLGLPTECVLTDMNEVLGRTAGNALEVAEVIAYLTSGSAEARLHAVTTKLAARCLFTAGLFSSESDASRAVDQALADGSAAEVFATVVAAQGGPTDLLERPDDHLAKANAIQAVYPREPGFIAEIDVRRVGGVVVELGGGRSKPDDVVDPSVGLSRVQGVGAEIGPDRPICFVHAASDDDASRAKSSILDSVRVRQEAPPPQNVVLETMPSADSST